MQSYAYTNSGEGALGNGSSCQDDVTGFGAEGSRAEPGSLRSQLAVAVKDNGWQIVERHQAPYTST